jgi:hypothetical protein
VARGWLVAAMPFLAMVSDRVANPLPVLLVWESNGRQTNNNKKLERMDFIMKCNI